MKNNQTNKVKKARFTKLKSFLKGKPYLAFGLSVGFLAVCIILSYIIRTPQETEEAAVEKPLLVEVDNGQVHYISAQAQLQKDDVVQIIAQAAGVVNKVNFEAGDQIKVGQAIINIASNYQGGNAAALQAQQTQLTYQNNKDTYQAQKDMIEINRQLALGQYDFNTAQDDWNKNDTLTDTKSTLNSINDSLRLLDQQIKAIEAVDPNNSNLISLKSTQAQLTGSHTQTLSSLRSLEFTADENNILSRSTEMQRDLTLKQLEVQEKGLDLQLKTSQISAQASAIQATLTAPTTPFAGTVEKINVKKGDMINPGQVIAVISAAGNNNQHAALLNVSAPAATAENYAAEKPAYLVLPDGNKVELQPEYVSSVPTTGAAYNFYFSLPLELASQIDTATYLTVLLPFETQQTNQRLIPIDAVYQTQFDNFVYVVGAGENGSPSAQIREIELGPVTGSLVSVKNGLASDELVILNRQVKNNQWVEIK